MADTLDPSPNWRFGAFELQGRTAELRKNGVVIHLQEQPSRLLVYLLEHAGQIVTRDDLRIHLWPVDTFVDFDHALNTAVMKLREALGDSSEKPLYIQTIPRRGYRFVAPVSLMPSGNSSAPEVRTAASEQVDPPAPPRHVEGDADTSPVQPQVTPMPPPLFAAEEPEPVPPKPPTPQKRSRNATRLVPLTAAALLLLALVSILLYNRLKAPAAPARSLTRITFDEGLQSDPTWSPDGRYIAYTAVRDGLTNVWMQQMSVGDPIQITTGPGPNWQPDWSPDGKYIAYRSDAVPAGLYVIPALGGVGQQRRVASFGCNPRWSPNGSQILFQSGPSPWKGVDRFYAVGLDGGPPRQVLAEFFKQHASILPISAAWHPDGKRVTVWAENRSTAEPAPHFWTVPLDGGPAVASEIAPQIEQKFRELAVNSGDEWVVDTKFAWAPAANAIYLERTFRGARNLWRLHMDPKTLRATSVDQLTASGGLDTGPAISPDGKRLAFTAANGRVSVWLYPFDPARGKITGPGRAVTSPGLDAWLPNLTPDGDKLAFSGVRAGQSHLWVKSLPDGREIPLFVDRLYRGNPQWSPDGTHLAYYRGGDKPDQGQLMMWSAETRQEEPLTSPRSSEPHLAIELVYDWTPNGKSILATKVMFRETAHEIRYEPSDSFGEQSLWQIPVSSAPHAELQERKIIADPSYDLYQAHMSPNQRWIVFEALPTNAANGDPDRPSSLFVRRATGGPWLPLVDDQNPADKPRWSPDGRILYFLWGRGSFYNVWGLHFDPETGKPKGEPFRVTSFDSPALMVPGHMGTVEISVSRNNLALTLGQLSGGIWVLDNVDR